MRHRIFGRKLNRDFNARKSLFKNLISSLIDNGQITTTEAKAKAVRGLMDKLVTRAKLGTLQSRRLLESFLQDKKLVNKMVDEIAPKFSERPGGFTRILRLERRYGDNAEMVKMEFVETVEAGIHAPIKGEIVKRDEVNDQSVKKVATKAEKKHATLVKPTKKTK
jgi:large subunit ribosomal protein L17